MKKRMKVLIRVMDAVLLAALVWGNPSVQTFAFWMISIMVVLMVIGCMGMNDDLAKKIHAGSGWRLAFRSLVPVLYVCALVFSGFPILAAMYATAALFILVSASSKMVEGAKP